MARERRENVRVEWASKATIDDGKGHWQHCVLKDLSDGGGKITGVAVSEVPDRLMLRFARGARGLRECKVIWRSSDGVGIEFSDRLSRFRLA
jgi:hypothetical protein